MAIWHRCAGDCDQEHNKLAMFMLRNFAGVAQWFCFDCYKKELKKHAHMR